MRDYERISNVLLQLGYIFFAGCMRLQSRRPGIDSQLLNFYARVALNSSRSLLRIASGIL